MGVLKGVKDVVGGTVKKGVGDKIKKDGAKQQAKGLAELGIKPSKKK